MRGRLGGDKPRWREWFRLRQRHGATSRHDRPGAMRGREIADLPAAEEVNAIINQELPRIVEFWESRFCK